MLIHSDYLRSRQNESRVMLQAVRRHISEILRSNRFYRNKYAAYADVVRSGTFDWSVYKSLPILTKAELIEDQMHHPPYGTNLTSPLHDYIFAKTTSGTSGTGSLTVLYTKGDFDARTRMLSPNIRAMYMPTPGLSVSMLFSMNPYWYLADMFSHAGYRIIPIETSSAESMLKHVLMSRVETLFVSPTGLLRLMDAAERAHVNLRDTLRLKFVYTGSESMMDIPHVRKLVESKFGCPFLSYVGSTEVGNHAQECVEGKNGMHLARGASIYEVRDPDTGRESLSGELVMTVLWRKGFPLIRYRTGDLVDLTTARCKCGYDSPRIKPGTMKRLSDRISLNGRQWNALDFESRIRKHVGLGEFRVIVKNHRGTDSVRVIAEMPMRNFFRPEKITEDLRRYFGIAASVRFVPPGWLARGTWKTVRVFDARMSPVIWGRDVYSDTIRLASPASLYQIIQLCIIRIYIILAAGVKTVRERIG